MRRIAVVGLDGLSWNILLPLLRRNLLKNLRTILTKSIYGILECIPPLTPPSWISIFTGVHTSKHGVLSFTKPSIVDGIVKWRLYTGWDVKYPYLNELLAINGMKGVVIDPIFPMKPLSSRLLETS